MVEAPLVVLDTAVSAPFKAAQAVVDAPTTPLRNARLRGANREFTERYTAQKEAARQKLIAQGRTEEAAAEIVPIAPVDLRDSGKASSQSLKYKRRATVSADTTVVDRPLPVSTGVAVPVPRDNDEKRQWRRKGTPSIVQTPVAVHPSMINLRDASAEAGNTQPAGTGTVTYQPAINAPTRTFVR